MVGPSPPSGKCITSVLAVGAAIMLLGIVIHTLLWVSATQDYNLNMYNAKCAKVTSVVFPRMYARAQRKLATRLAKLRKNIPSPNTQARSAASSTPAPPAPTAPAYSSDVTLLRSAAAVKSITSGVCIVYADWCGICHMMVPEANAAAKTVPVFAINTDVASGSSLPRAAAFPTVWRVVDGQVRDTHVGWASKDALIELHSK